MSSLIYEATFPSHANGCERVITRNHPTRQMGGAERLDCGRSSRFQSIFKDNKAEELKTRLCLLSVGIQSLNVCIEINTTNRFIRCAFNHESPSMLFPAIAITRYPLFV